MSDIKFACPNCQQHIQCGLGYAGMEIPCPTCQVKMTVPTPAGVPAPAMAAAAPAPALRIGAAPPPAPAAAPEVAAAAGAPTCPSCGNEVSPRAIMCVKCGTNLRTGQKMTTPGGRPGMGGARPVKAPAGPVIWYKTAYPYLGVYFAILALLYFLGNSQPLMKVLCLGGLLAYIVTAKIIVTVFAFKDDGAGKGFLCLCLDIYAVYYVFKQSERPISKLLYGVACVLGLLLKFDILNFDFKDSP